MRVTVIQWIEYVFDIFTRGGIVMYPLFLCSILALAIVIEKYVVLRRKKVFPPDVINIIPTIRGIDDIERLNDTLDSNRCCLSNILKITTEEYDASPEVAREYLEEQGRQEVMKLEKGLTLLETIASIAPLLGLLGTVLGMIKVFTEISAGGLGDAARLSGGISEALITTVFGLSIGIPALVFYNYFNNKSLKIVLEMEKYSSLLLRRFRKK